MFDDREIAQILLDLDSPDTVSKRLAALDSVEAVEDDKAIERLKSMLPLMIDISTVHMVLLDAEGHILINSNDGTPVDESWKG